MNSAKIGGPEEVVLITVLSNEMILGEEVVDCGNYIDIKNAVYFQVQQSPDGSGRAAIQFAPVTEFDYTMQQGAKAPTIRLFKNAIFHMTKPNSDIEAKYREVTSPIIIAAPGAGGLVR